MNISGTDVRRLEEGNIEQEVPSHALPQAPIDLLNENMTIAEFKLEFKVIGQSVIA